VFEGLGTYVREGMDFSQREAQRANWWTPPPFAVDSSRPLFERFAHGPVVNVRWQANASEAGIAEAESRHRLVRQSLNSPQSWTYEMRRWSTSDIEQLVKDPLAADTQGIDRSTYSLQVSASAPTPPPHSSISSGSCPSQPVWCWQEPGPRQRRRFARWWPCRW
jgi:hypothetical protein